MISIGKIVDGVYYGSDGKPAHRGMVCWEGKLYYAGKNGVLVRGVRKRVHHGMANGLVHHGSYYFGTDGVCYLESFQSREDTAGRGYHGKKTSYP